jgi:cell division protein FtsZ
MVKKSKKIAKRIAEKIPPKTKTERVRAVRNLWKKNDNNIKSLKKLEVSNGVKKIKVRVIGIGGGGENIISEIAQRIKNKVSFFAADTDLKTFNNLPRNVEKFQFGQDLTQGLGSGMNPEIAETAAKNERERIKQILKGQDFVILIASLGGGVGSGAGPIFSQISQNLGNITYGIFTLPFSFEGEKKMEIAKDGLRKLRRKLNSFTILPNERIFQMVEKNTPLKKAFSLINKSLADSLENLIELICQPGLINIDFADLKTIFEGLGSLAYLNTVEIEKDKEKEAIEKALNSPLYPYNIEGAKGVLFNIWGPKDLSLAQVSQISKMIFEKADKEAKIIFGISPTHQKNSETKVMLLATGCNKPLHLIVGGKAKSHLPTKPKQKKQNLPAVKPSSSPKNGQPRGKKKIQSPFTDSPPSAAPVVETFKKPARMPQKFSTGRLVEKTRLKGSKPTDKDKVKSKITKATKTSADYPIRKNALSIKKEIEKEEAEMLAREKFWETPAFMRRQKLL